MVGSSSADSGTYAGPERRRFRKPGQPPADVLREMPGDIVFDRLPVAALAVGADGRILFANATFAAMLGYAQDRMQGMHFEKIFPTLPADRPAVEVIRAYADAIVDLTDRDGFTVRARMSKSALVRRDDNIALVTFQDLTDRLWEKGR